MNPNNIHRYGSKERELDRTAEMIVDLHKRGHIARAIWLIYDGNRFDAEAMKFLAERVEAWSKDPHPRAMRTWIFPLRPGFSFEVTAASREDAIARAVERLNTRNPPEPVLKE